MSATKTTAVTSGSDDLGRGSHGSHGRTVPATAVVAGAPVSAHSSGPNDSAYFRVAGAAAFLALAALMVGGVAMGLTTQTGESTAETLAAISTNPWPFLAGGVGLALVSAFDILTIPGLHAALGRHGRVLIVLASVSAVVGDLLGIVGRLAQTALVPIGQQTTDASGTDLLAAGRVLSVLDTTINTAGFVLVSVSFTCFGLLMLRGFSRRIGWVAIVAGVFTLVGQIPALAPLFMVANAAYIVWYVGLGRRFWQAARKS